MTARCGRPNLPPKAQLLHISQRNRFDSNEKITVNCEENQFSHHKQERVCKNGYWTGKKARCGK